MKKWYWSCYRLWVYLSDHASHSLPTVSYMYSIKECDHQDARWLKGNVCQKPQAASFVHDGNWQESCVRTPQLMKTWHVQCRSFLTYPAFLPSFTPQYIFIVTWKTSGLVTVWVSRKRSNCSNRFMLENVRNDSYRNGWTLTKWWIPKRCVYMGLENGHASHGEGNDSKLSCWNSIMAGWNPSIARFASAFARSYLRLGKGSIQS